MSVLFCDGSVLLIDVDRFKSNFNARIYAYKRTHFLVVLFIFLSLVIQKIRTFLQNSRKNVLIRSYTNYNYSPKCKTSLNQHVSNA